MRAATSQPPINATKRSSSDKLSSSPKARTTGAMIVLPWRIESVCVSSKSRQCAAMPLAKAAYSVESFTLEPQTGIKCAFLFSSIRPFKEFTAFSCVLPRMATPIVSRI